MRVLITGANGFIGRNLHLQLSELPDMDVASFVRKDSLASLKNKLNNTDAVIHLAGVNRPKNESEYGEVNQDLTATLCNILAGCDKQPWVIFASSIQADLDNPYGISKRKAEETLRNYSKINDSRVFIYRLPNVFGKWCRPEYNSVVATFSHNIANGLPIDIHDENVEITLVYIDDVIASFKQALAGDLPKQEFYHVQPSYQITLGALATQLYRFRESRENLLTETTGKGLTRALYATYLSYLVPDVFSYSLTEFCDERGRFVEFLKTNDSGQFSFFTAKPGITRGGHYHHTKSEKFLVVQGQALFKFRHMHNGRTHEITVTDDNVRVVETIPGWAHDITNTGKEDLIVLLWANENFDPDLPDTIGAVLDD